VEEIEIDPVKRKLDLMYWKLAIWKLIHGSFTVVASGFIGATAAVDWGVMSGKEKVLICLTLAMALGKFIDAFLDQTLSRLVAGKPLVQLPETNGNGHSTQIATTTDTTTTVTKT